MKRIDLIAGARPNFMKIAPIIALLHVFVVPLDVLWFAALRRLGIE